MERRVLMLEQALRNERERNGTSPSESLRGLPSLAAYLGRGEEAEERPLIRSRAPAGPAPERISVAVQAGWSGVNVCTLGHAYVGRSMHDRGVPTSRAPSPLSGLPGRRFQSAVEESGGDVGSREEAHVESRHAFRSSADGGTAKVRRQDTRRALARCPRVPFDAAQGADSQNGGKELGRKKWGEVRRSEER